MPVEMRRLVFSDHEIAEAINMILKAEWTKLEAQMDKARAMGKLESMDGGGTVQKVVYSKEDPLEVTATVKSRRGRVGERVFAASEMQHLLIAFCRNAKIPIARSAQKTLRRAKVGVALDMTVRGWSAGQGIPVPQTGVGQ